MNANNQNRVFLGLGGNLGAPLERFREAREQLTRHPLISAVRSSPLYRSPAVGGPPGQPAYLNAVLDIDTGLPPRELLQLGQKIEQAAGRRRDVPWGPRTLDIDLLLYNDLTLQELQLTIPHPHMHQRHFVLRPLCDLEPRLKHPLLGETVEDLLQRLPDTEGLSRIQEQW